MNRDEAKQLLPIIQAFAEGREVEFKEFRHAQTGAPDTPWVAVTDLMLRASCQFRIKPEPKLRPWKPEEMPKGFFLVVAKDCPPSDRWERMYACRAAYQGDRYPNSPWSFQVSAPNQTSRTSYGPAVMADQFIVLHSDGSTSPCGVLEAE